MALSLGPDFPSIQAVEPGAAATPDGRLELGLRSELGTTFIRVYPAVGAVSGAIMVGGVGGGWDTPAGHLYPKLCRLLAGRGITGMRVLFRDSTDLDEAVWDLRTGIVYLHEQGIERVGLVGHSLGGAVVIRAALGAATVRTVVTLASQSYGATAVAELPEGWLDPVGPRHRGSGPVPDLL